MSCTKVNWKWIKNLNVPPKPIKLEQNIKGMLPDIDFDKYFLNTTPKAQAKKAKIYKWDNIQLKRFCTAKERSKHEKTTYSIRESIIRG
jgi:hypothetical protein